MATEWWPDSEGTERPASEVGAVAISPVSVAGGAPAIILLARAGKMAVDIAQAKGSLPMDEVRELRTGDFAFSVKATGSGDCIVTVSGDCIGTVSGGDCVSEVMVDW